MHPPPSGHKLIVKDSQCHRAPLLFLLFCQLNGPSNVIPFSRRDRDRTVGWGWGGGCFSSPPPLVWRDTVLCSPSLPSGPSAQRSCPRSRLTYLQQYFLTQGRNGRAQITVIMLPGSRCHGGDYVRWGLLVVCLLTRLTCEAVWRRPLRSSFAC